MGNCCSARTLEDNGSSYHLPLGTLSDEPDVPDPPDSWTYRVGDPVYFILYNGDHIPAILDSIERDGNLVLAPTRLPEDLPFGWQGPFHPDEMPWRRWDYSFDITGKRMDIEEKIENAIHWRLRSDLEMMASGAPPKKVRPRWNGMKPEEPLETTTKRVQVVNFDTDFGFSGAKQNGLGPHFWGITYEQISELSRDEKYDGSMTMYEVVEKVVKPLTKGKGIGYALLKNPGGRRATVMVSHAWGECFTQFQSALSGYAKEHRDAAFWICGFAIYQNEDLPDITIVKQLGAEPSTGPFATVLKQADCMIAVFTDTCDIYTRMWCVFEMFTAVEMGVPVQLLSFHALTLQSSDSVNSKVARCGNPTLPQNGDERMIRDEIETKPGSYATIDKVVSWIKITAMMNFYAEDYSSEKDMLNTQIAIAVSMYESRFF